MTISYNLPTQTVALDIKPAEIKELADDGIEAASKLFQAIKNKVQTEVGKP